MNQREESLIVQMLIFSGRPDPRWALDEEAITELRDRMRKALGGERVDQPRTRRLGYRGFLVTNLARIPDLPAEFTVYRGVLTEEPGPKARYWRDTAGVEEFLIAQARRQELGDLLKAAGIEEAE